MIRIVNVTKSFHSTRALDNVSLHIKDGEVLGVLGPNGAGKTTLFKLIAGLLNPDSGRIEAEGQSWPAIGYKPERLLFPNKMRVREYLNMICSLANISRVNRKKIVDASLVRVNLVDAADKKIKDCSKGMRQRLGLAQAMIGDPPFLLLDEPSNGLDPEGQNDICHHIEELHQAGNTIVLASHQLQEVTQVCTYLVILNEGQILYKNSMDQALAVKPHVSIKIDGNVAKVRNLLESLHPGISTNINEIVLVDDAIGLRRQVLRILLNSGYDISYVEHKRVTLSEIYSKAIQ
ncbi:MAG: ABC transporter ATP-binding protein [Anaerolineae bacterium]|nr:MAG: ABC transporter ATP-binding protein [Anaerolineae bacterium]